MEINIASTLNEQNVLGCLDQMQMNLNKVREVLSSMGTHKEDTHHTLEAVEDIPHLRLVKDAKRKDNKSGYNGVFWNKKEKAYRASVCVHGRRKVKCGFKTAEEAKVAYENLKRDLYAEIGVELGVESQDKGNPPVMDMHTLEALNRDAWMSWAHDMMNRAVSGWEPKALREVERATNSRLKSRLWQKKCHAYLNGQDSEQVEALTVYDVIADSNKLRRVFTGIVVRDLCSNAIKSNAIPDNAIPEQKKQTRQTTKGKRGRSSLKAG